MWLNDNNQYEGLARVTAHRHPHRSHGGLGTNSLSGQGDSGTDLRPYETAARDGGYAVYVDSATLGKLGTGGTFGLVVLNADKV